MKYYRFAEKATFLRLIKNVSACGGQGARKRPKAAPAVKFLPEDGPNGLSRGIHHGGQMGVFQQPAIDATKDETIGEQKQKG